MHHLYPLSHDLTPHSLRRNKRVKERASKTQDAICWGSPQLNTLPFSSERKGQLELRTLQRFKVMAN